MDNVLKEKFNKIKLLVMDFDGVLTDNRVLIFDDGREAVFCNRSDSLGIEMIKKNGIEVVVISKEKNSVVQARCKKLQIECWDGVDKKIDLFLQILEKKKIMKEEVCYIGNDINDLDCIGVAGIGVAVADACKFVLKSADYVTKNKGGYEAVREIADIILINKGK